jgi:hypothetical protein
MSNEKPQKSFRMNNDVAEAVDDYTDRHDISQSDLLRRITYDWYQDEYQHSSPTTTDRLDEGPVRTVLGVIFLLAPATAVLDLLTAYGTALATVSISPATEVLPTLAGTISSVIIGAALIGWVDRSIQSARETVPNDEPAATEAPQ